MPPTPLRLDGRSGAVTGVAVVLVTFGAGLAGARLVDTATAPTTTVTRGTGAVPAERPSPAPPATASAPAVPTMADLIPPPVVVTARAQTPTPTGGRVATPQVPRRTIPAPTTVGVTVLTFTPATATP